MTSLDGSYDLLVIGGGINGVGIARDAAGRGLSVLLSEKGDLGEATSSASTKLIHGGLRYLEHYEFRLVREALKEREVLLRAAPHIIRPLTFILPHEKHLRPRWMIRLGLFIYDHLAPRERLAGSRSLDLTRHPAGRVLKAATAGFSYSDCWVDDARLVVLNAMDARARGARILTRSPFLSARREGPVWRVRLETDGNATEVEARALVNAAGPWAKSVAASIGARPQKRRLRLVKGSHIVIRRRLPSEDAFIFQNADRRIVFAIPYQKEFCLVGTTDTPYEGDPSQVQIDEEEVGYLIAAVNRYFADPVSPDDILWSFSGVRPLFDDGHQEASAITRDYAFDLHAPKGHPPLLTILGGKLTTYRRLSEHAMDRLARFLPAATGPWTAQAQLPGGDIPAADPAVYARQLRDNHPWLPEPLAQRFAANYGTLCEMFLADAGATGSLGKQVAPDLYEGELRYLVDHEWAVSAEDILWRRTKLGLTMPQDCSKAIASWMALQPTPA